MPKEVTLPERKDDNNYSVTLSGREIYWLIHLANEELKRLQDRAVAEGKSMEEAKAYFRYGPISDAFTKLLAADSFEPTLAEFEESIEKSIKAATNPGVINYLSNMLFSVQIYHAVKKATNLIGNTSCPT